jgi:hypothetical protein
LRRAAAVLPGGIIVGLDQDTDPAALSPGQIDAILEKIRTPSLAGGDDVAGEAR